MLVSLPLMLNLLLITWLRFVVWFGIGLVICGTHGVRHSRLRLPSSA
jgi:APA family basic amino acid/polyamine antiporter